LEGSLEAFLVAFGVVFVAEFGDKTQLLTLGLAARYRALPVLLGLVLGAALLNALSVTVGALLGARLPTELVNIVAGLLFIGFAVWTLRDRDDEDDLEGPDVGARRGFVAAAVTSFTAFVLAELGDKSMLAAFALGARQSPLWTWAGAAGGMIVGDGLALLAGRTVLTRLPERVVRLGGAAVFALIGLVLIVGEL